MNDFFHNNDAQSGPIESLGQTFPSDQARREHFLKSLAEKLKDPEFRKQEGFPQGTDDAILAMSDPPYYTACPNPWLVDFVAHYGKPYDPEVKYSREPLAIDVSVGKTDQIYKAHSYHTKVPHLAIVPSILHYTQPGDIVLEQAFSVLAEHACVERPLGEVHVEEPAEQHVVAELLAELTLASDRVERHQEHRLQQALWRDRWSAPVRVHALEHGVELMQYALHQRPDAAERMVRRDHALDRHQGQHRRLFRGLAAHVPIRSRAA